jgi:hypothetical protein
MIDTPSLKDTFGPNAECKFWSNLKQKIDIVSKNRTPQPEDDADNPSESGLGDPAYIFMDGEFGGIGMQYSLLSMYFMVTDKNFNYIGFLDLNLKPDDGIYHVNGTAMGINKINLVDHDVIAETYKAGGTKLYAFLNEYSNRGAIKLIPVGHGFSGDLDHIFDKLMSRNTWETFVSYRRLDTSVALQFLKTCGYFPEEVSGSLESLIEYFKLTSNGKLHEAKTDTLFTIDVLKKMINLIPHIDIKTVPHVMH